MKPCKSLAYLLMLLMSAGVWAEGGKQRGDEGQGEVVQTQNRITDPPAQWSAESNTAQPTAAAATEDEPSPLETLLDSLQGEEF